MISTLFGVHLPDWHRNQTMKTSSFQDLFPRFRYEAYPLRLLILWFKILLNAHSKIDNILYTSLRHSFKSIDIFSQNRSLFFFLVLFGAFIDSLIYFFRLNLNTTTIVLKENRILDFNLFFHLNKSSKFAVRIMNYKVILRISNDWMYSRNRNVWNVKLTLLASSDMNSLPFFWKNKMKSFGLFLFCLRALLEHHIRCCRPFKVQKHSFIAILKFDNWGKRRQAEFT